MWLEYHGQGRGERDYGELVAGERRTPGIKLSHDLSSAKMASEGHRLVVLISGSGERNDLAESPPL